MVTGDLRTSGRVRLLSPDTLRGLVVGASRKGVMSVTNGQINSTGFTHEEGRQSILMLWRDANLR